MPESVVPLSSLPRLSLLSISFAVALAAGCASRPAPPPGIQTLAGGGTPVVVLQSGLGDDRSTWNEILPALAAHYTVFAHDRPGTGNHPFRPGPRDPCTMAAEQRAALRAAGLAPPYLLVGHSLGGLYQYAYASLYPQDVAGFVLIDPTHPRQWAEIQRQLPAAAVQLKGIRAVVFGAAQRREFDDQARCLDRTAFAHPPGVPGHVLIAGRPQAGSPDGFEALRFSLAREWPALAGTADVEMVWDSAHYIHRERPARVIAAIRRLASPGACPDGCAAPERALEGAAIGGHAPLDLVFGETRREQVEAALGTPRKTYSAPDVRVGTVSAYHRKPDEMPLALSFIPFAGDLLDAVQMAQEHQEWHELIVEYDTHGVVRRAGVRRIE